MSSTKRLSTFEIGAAYGVTPRSLRFYKDQGLLSPIIEDGDRLYTEKDRIRLELILKGKNLGFSFVELRSLILQTIEQRKAQGLLPPNVGLVNRSSQAEDVEEEIRQIERDMENLTKRLGVLRVSLDRLKAKPTT